jgi:hypothetical protein
MNTREIEHMWKVASNNPNHDTNWHDPVVVAFAKMVAAQRQWVGLTDEERTEIRREHYARTLPLMDAIEAKLRSKNA